MSYYTRSAVAGTNLTQFTKSFWLKRGDNDTGIHQVFSIGGNTNSEGFIQLRFNDDNGGATLRLSGQDAAGAFNMFSKSKYMDSQWMHLVIRYDGSQGTNANKIRMYVNGDQVVWDTAPSGPTYPTGSAMPSTFYSNSFWINTAKSIQQDGDHHYAEMYFVDGQSLAPSVFAQSDSTTGKWRAKAPNTVRTAINNFGNNGYYLSFQDATSSTTLGYDYQTADRSGTTNDFTANGSVIYGINSSPDNDFPIMNEMYRDYYGWDFDHGGLKISTDDTGTLQQPCIASKNLPRTGKWWFEVKLLDLTTTSSGGTGNFFGFMTTGEREFVRWGYSHNGSANGNEVSMAPGSSSNIGSGGGTGYPAVNDWYGFGADMDNGTFLVYKNGTQLASVSYDFVANSVNNYIPFFRNDEGVAGRGSVTEFNFGQGHTVTANSGDGYTDDNGQGKFQYAPPSGYLSLCDANIPDVTITPSEHCNFVYYDGNSSDNRAIDLGFQPDLILSKRTQNNASWYWIDSIRGATRPLTHSTAQQGNETAQVKSFTSTGVTIGTDANINGSGTNGYLMVGWKGGGTAVTNTDGTIDSTVSANPTAGFSVVKYTTQSGTYSVGHGLGKKPDLILIKGNYDSADASNTYNWDVYTPDNSDTGGAGFRLKLNNTDLRETQASPFSIEPDEDVFTQNNNSWYANNVKNIAYCFTSIEGYSSFGYYNGRADSHVFVHTGFAPKFVVCKPYQNGTPTTGWRWFDRTLAPYNNQGTDYALYMNNNNPRAVQNGVDLHSNGFSIYGEGDDNLNHTGVIYFYMAFAETPAEFARGVG